MANNNKTLKKGISLGQYGMMIMLVAVYVLFAIITKGKNLTPMNINNLIMQNGYVVILAVGMLLCVLTGNVDLGVGSVVASCGAVAGNLIVDMGWSSPMAMLGALGVGVAFGLFVGFFVAYLQIPPFIVTLATMLMGRGLCYVILQAQTKGPLPADYNCIGTGFLPTIKVMEGAAINDGKGVDLICLIVTAVVSILLILNELSSRATAKKNGLPVGSVAVAVGKLVILIGVIGFFFFKLA